MPIWIHDDGNDIFMQVYDQGVDGWWLVETEGNVGYAPASHLQFTPGSDQVSIGLIYICHNALCEVTINTYNAAPWLLANLHQIFNWWTGCFLYIFCIYEPLNLGKATTLLEMSGVFPLDLNKLVHDLMGKRKEKFVLVKS